MPKTMIRLSAIVEPINIFSLVLLIGFFAMLVLLFTGRYEQFKQSHRHIAEEAVATAANELENTLNNRKTLISIFVEDNINDIRTLTREPENVVLQQRIEAKLQRYFPDFFTISIGTESGKPVLDHFDGKIGEICMLDMQNTVKSGQSLIRVHPNPFRYHIDIMVNYRAHGKKYLFLVSFGLERYAKVLNIASPDNHQLMTILPMRNQLIELTEQGGRDTIQDRLEFRMSDSEKSRVLARKDVANTLWQVIDMHTPLLFENYKTRLLYEGIKIYSVFFVIVLLMWIIIKRQEKRRQLIEHDLIENNKLITLLNQQLEQLSITDELTGLYNRRYLKHWLEEQWGRCKRAQHGLALAMIDVDYFKQYNDFYGHKAGDKCLQTISSIMQGNFNRSGEITARYGGEEFVVVLTETNLDKAINSLHNFKSALREHAIPHEKSGVSNLVTVSIGLVYCVPKKQTSLDSLIEQADRMLYEAKRHGRNRIQTGTFDDKSAISND